jgi:hypothetical protein
MNIPDDPNCRTELPLFRPSRKLSIIYSNPWDEIAPNFPADSPAGLILEIDIRQLLAGAVLHDETGFQFIDRPGRREAAVPKCQASGLAGALFGVPPSGATDRASTAL